VKKIYDDWYLLRFCRAQDWKEKKIIEMFEEFHKIREHNKVDLILQYDLAKFEKKARAAVTIGYTGWDRAGYPIKYVKIQKADAKMLENMKPGVAMLYGLRFYETSMNVIFPYMTAMTKKRIDRETIVFDFGPSVDLSGLLGDKNVKLYIKIIADIANRFYPGTANTAHIINAPAAMQTFWPLIQSFVPSNAKSCVILHKKDYQKELFKHIDPKHLPDIVGGEIKNWPENKLPWTDYLNFCYERKTFFHDESMKIGDPLDIIKKNPLDRKKIAEFLIKKKAAIEAAQKKQAANSTKTADAIQKKPVQTTAKATEPVKKTAEATQKKPVQTTTKATEPAKKIQE